MGVMKAIDIEIKNSKALSYMWHEIAANRKALDTALEQRAKDWDQIQQLDQRVQQLDKRIHALEAKRVCGQCGAKVPRNEWHLVYTSKYSFKDKESGVCESCWQEHYVPYMRSKSTE